MTRPDLNSLAQRLERDPFFVGCSLRLYAQSEGLSEEQLAMALGCSTDDLTSLRLCRAPTSEPGQFQKCLRDITARFPVNPDILAEALRRGQAILALAQPGGATNTLAAARDGKAGSDNPAQGGGP